MRLGLFANCACMGFCKKIDSPSLENEFRSLFVETIVDLEKSGVTSIGRIPTEEVLKRFQEVEVRFVPKLSVTDREDPNSLRHGGEWNKDKKMILISEHHWTRGSLAQKRMLGTHEALGAIDIEDNELDKTSAIDSYRELSKMKDFKKKEQVLKALRQSIEMNTQRGGGATGVGGGGDYRLIDFKTNVILFLTGYLERDLISLNQYESLLMILGFTKPRISSDVPSGSWAYEPGFVVKLHPSLFSATEGLQSVYACKNFAKSLVKVIFLKDIAE